MWTTVGGYRNRVIQFTNPTGQANFGIPSLLKTKDWKGLWPANEAVYACQHVHLVVRQKDGPQEVKEDVMKMFLGL